MPTFRVTASRPFQVTGIDFAGPFYAKGKPNGRKCYIALFTCAAVRSVNLELRSDLTTDTFLLVFQRFIGRRGLPHTIYTDSAQTFQAANKELAELWQALSATKTHRLIAQHGITWKFIAPRAARLGGWCERIVGTTKRCLRKVLGLSQATDEELATTRQHRSRPEFEAHNSEHRGCINTSSFCLWRKTDSVTLWNRTTN
jgi:hypothetical protein